MYDFANELRLFGPDADTPQAFTLSRAQRYSRSLARSSYENFTVVSWLLPRHLRQAFFDVYAYCRWSDDLADEASSPRESLRLLDWWQSELDACFLGRGTHPVMIALGDTIRRHALSRQPLVDLLVAFRRDQSVTRYETFEQLLDYCRYSAHPVGHIVLELGGCRDRTTEPLADAICTGLQLANFWQDVARDFHRGRVYLPRDLRERHGYTDSMLDRREFNAAFRSLLAALVRDAEGRFAQGQTLVEHVPRWLRLDVSLFLRGGLAILDGIRRQNYDVWRRRPAISKGAKVRLMLWTMAELFVRRGRPTPAEPQ